MVPFDGIRKCGERRQTNDPQCPAALQESFWLPLQVILELVFSQSSSVRI